MIGLTSIIDCKTNFEYWRIITTCRVESTTFCYGQIVTLNKIVTDKMLQEVKCYTKKLLQVQMLHTIRMLRDSYVTQLVCYENTFCYNVVANLTLHRHPPLPALLLLEQNPSPHEPNVLSS